MIVHRFEVDGYSWNVTIYYVSDDDSTGLILNDVQVLGAGQDDIRQLGQLLDRKEHDTGYIYSNLLYRRSVIIVFPVSSSGELQNTLDHEKGHLVSHICIADNIWQTSEEAQYLAGQIGEKVFSVARHLLCGNP